MNKLLICFISLYLFIVPVFAEQIEGRVKLGDVSIEYKKENAFIYYKDKFVLKSIFLSGGHMYPGLYMSESGEAVVADVIQTDKTVNNGVRIDENKFLISKDIQVVRLNSDRRVLFIDKKNKKECKINFNRKMLGSISVFDGFQKKGDLLVAAEDQAGMLISSFDSYKKINAYSFVLLNFPNCKISKVEMGNPDYIAELGWSSKGNWWAVGATNQTLLRSVDGIKWSNIKLPDDIYSLISAYAVSKDEVWLAAGIASITSEDDPMLIRSLNGGASWENIKINSEQIKFVPSFWLEGQGRIQLK